MPVKAAPKQHHIDKRADALIGVSGDDDDLLTTREIAEWFGVSEQWLEIGRSKGYGPPFLRMSERCIRYRRGNAREYLRKRTFASTAAYARRKSA
jgi:hypothetical protein